MARRIQSTPGLVFFGVRWSRTIAPINHIALASDTVRARRCRPALGQASAQRFRIIGPIGAEQGCSWVTNGVADVRNLRPPGPEP